MNGKLARALRRAKTNTLELVDEPRIVRHYGRLGMLADMGPKFKKQCVHKPKDAIPATWPKTKNQRAQGRPMISVHPVRLIRSRIASGSLPGWFAQVGNLEQMPKHALDKHATGT